MLEFVLFAVVLVVFLLGFLFYLSPGNPAKPTTVPGLAPCSSEDGNLPDISDAGSLPEFLMELHTDFGPVASFWLGRQFVVSTASVDTFRAQMGCFDRPIVLYKQFEKLIGVNSIQYANGSEGRAMRSAWDASMSQENCEAMMKTFQKISDDLAEKWNKVPAGEHIPLRQYAMIFTLKSVLVCLCGDFFNNDEVLLKFSKAYDVCWNELEQINFDSESDTADLKQKNFQKSMDILRTIVTQLIENRKKSGTEGSRLLIDEIIDFPNASEQFILDNLLTYIVGGFHTTGNLMTWLIYFLAGHQECQDRLYNEYIEVLGQKDSIWPAAAAQLHYVRQVIDESMRLSSLAPYAARCSNVEMELNGHIIPKDTPVIQALGVLLQDSSYWPNPSKFDPDRFNSTAANNRDPLCSNFFGFAGKRKCPGFRFVYIEVITVMSVLSRKFKFRLADASQVVLPHFGLVSRPTDEIWVTLEKREENL